MNATLARTVVTSLTIVVLGLLWWWSTAVAKVISPGSFPSPAEVRDAFVQAVTTGYADARLQQHCVSSLLLIAAGFLSACAVAVPLGIAMGAVPRVYRIVNPLFQLLRPIPPLAWIPLAILWLGLGDAAKIMVIVCGAFPPALINTIAGVRAIDPRLIEASRMLGTPPLRHALQVLVPGALPSLFTGLRVALQASWTTLVAAELVGSLAGIGHILNAAQQDIFPSMIVLGMVCVAVFGWASTGVLAMLEQRIRRRRQLTESAW